MSREVVAEVIALIELGMIAPEDIVKCLRKANSEPAQQEFVSPGGGYVPAIPAQQRPIKTFHGGKPWPVQEPAQQKPFGYFKAEPFGWTDCAETDEGAVALYERPPAQQEPVSFLDWYDNAHWGNEDFKAGCWRAWDAALAQRTWVGLTPERRSEIESEVLMRGDNYPEVLAAIEAKLKEKNT